MNELRCLAYNPFDGGKGDEDVIALRDRFLVTRTSHKCTICFVDIQPRERVRAKTEVNRDNHQVQTFYFCPLCCAAMAISQDDAGDAIEARTAIGMRASGQIPSDPSLTPSSNPGGYG